MAQPTAPTTLAAERTYVVNTKAVTEPRDLSVQYAIGHSFDVLVTTDFDGQHEPSRRFW